MNFLKSYYKVIIVFLTNILMIPCMFLNTCWGLLFIGILASINFVFRGKLASLSLIPFILMFTTLSFRLSVILEFENPIAISFSYMVMIMIASMIMFIFQGVSNIRSAKDGEIDD